MPCLEVATLAQLALKFVFANVVEVKLVEADQVMKMWGASAFDLETKRVEASGGDFDGRHLLRADLGSHRDAVGRALGGLLQGHFACVSLCLRRLSGRFWLRVGRERVTSPGALRPEFMARCSVSAFLVMWQVPGAVGGQAGAAFREAEDCHGPLGVEGPSLGLQLRALVARRWAES